MSAAPPDWRARRGIALTRLKRTVQLGAKSLWLHRLRSLLTVLGIVFGVCSVIAMLAVGEGASSEAQEQIRRLGSTNIIVRSVKPVEERPPTASRGYAIQYGLTYRDIEQIRDTIPAVTGIMPGRIIRKPVSVGRVRLDIEIVGTLPKYQHLRHLDMRAGRFLSDVELAHDANACVLSASLAAKLFPIDDPLSKTVRVGSDYYRVIGVAGDEGGGVPQATGAPNPAGGAGARAGSSMRMYIPLTAAKTRFGELLIKRQAGSFEAERVQLHEATIMVDEAAHVEETAAVVRRILTSNHKKDDFEIVVPLELLRNAERTKRIFNVVLGAIAAISLIVGGIGIMNIMLASVTERTREIGIRRALGARKRDIVIQFLAETVILSGAGGVLGVALGVLIPFAISYFAEMKTIVTPWAPVLAFSISGLVGIVFGIYPALRAAEMDPVEALRHE